MPAPARKLATKDRLHLLFGLLLLGLLLLARLLGVFLLLLLLHRFLFLLFRSGDGLDQRVLAQTVQFEGAGLRVRRYCEQERSEGQSGQTDSSLHAVASFPTAGLHTFPGADATMPRAEMYLFS